MVVLTGAVMAVPAANGVVATGALTGAISGVISGVLNTAITKGPAGTAVAAATAVGGAASAMLGSAAAAKVGAVGTGVVTGAALSSLFGVGAAAGVSSAICGAASLVSEMISGPVGLIIVGIIEGAESPDVYTFDCWKQILHDDSSKPSHGKMLKEVVMDPRIKQVTTMINNNDSDLPHLVLQNIWDEQFRIDYVSLPSDRLAAHAVQI